MKKNIKNSSIPERFDHLLNVIGNDRFLKMDSLNGEVPFFICDYKPSEQVQIVKLQKQLINRLEQNGIKVLEVNLFDLCVTTLKIEGDFEWYLKQEPSMEKSRLLEDFQSILDVENVIVPAIAKQLSENQYDVLFITGVGEVFPFIRSHNVLNNLQKTAKLQPTVIFFPGSYSHSLETGASLELFSLLRDDKYYRAYNIFDYQI